MRFISLKKHFMLIMVLILGTGLLLTGSDKNPINVDKKGIVIKGFGPVAYFTKGKPVKGSSEFQHDWSSAI